MLGFMNKTPWMVFFPLLEETELAAKIYPPRAATAKTITKKTVIAQTPQNPLVKINDKLFY